MSLTDSYIVAMMSRPVAGVRGNTVIVTLPGSPKGAKENLQAIVKLLPHACLQAKGVDSRSLHKGGPMKLEEEAGTSNSKSHQGGCGHQHHHHHNHNQQKDPSQGQSHGHGSLVRHTDPKSNPLSNNPNLGPGRRYRESPYPMVPVAEALELVEIHSPGPVIVEQSVDENIVGSVLAADVKARENVPAFRASIVDGYAVVVPRDGKLQGTFPVVGVSHASPGEGGKLKEGEVIRITTGAPLPPGATSVIMVEDTTLKSMTTDDMEEKEIEIQVEGVREGENVREIGSDVEHGSVVLQQGEQISSVGGEIGLLSSVGVSKVDVYRRPIVGILSTGDELVEYNSSQTLRLGEVRDTNRITLISAVKHLGFEVVDLGIAKDKPGTLEEILREGLRRVDILITTGGVSMGELDLLKPTIERSLGGVIHFGRVAMKPGKPTTFATVQVKDNSGNRVSKMIFSLPGNPASALVTFHLFVLPSLHKQSGVSPVGLPKLTVVLAHDFSLDSRPEYHRAVVTAGADGRLTASTTGSQRSSKVGSLRSANALVCMPSGRGKLQEGSTVEALLLSAVRPRS